MVRYTFFVLVVLGSAATALAAIAPEMPLAPAGKNVTTIEKNQPFPVLGPLIVEDCAVEDCSDIAV